VRAVGRTRYLGYVALGAIALAWALPMQSVGCPQNAYYAGARAIASGVPYIDRYAEQTCDLVKDGGHYYAAKAPNLDLWSTPWYALLHSMGAVPRDRNRGLGYPDAMVGVPLRAIWQIGVWAVVLPALILLVLVRRTADEIEPGTGTTVAAILGLGTLVLPFSTLLFSHVPAATAELAAFMLLFRGRRPMWAGVCAGLAIGLDFPFAISALAIGLYAAARRPRLRRVGEYALGGAVGLLPVWAFDTWAFGNPFHLGYAGTAGQGAAGGWQMTGFFGQTAPSFHIAVSLLLSQRGLLVLTPVLAAATAGCAVLWRRGLRAEAALIGGLTLVEIAWNSARHPTDAALGGWVPGPRFLIPLLPFLCIALAPLIRRAPATLGALAAVSIGAMAIATSAEPLLSNDDTHHWIARIADGNFAATWLSLFGIGHGWLAITPFYALVLVAMLAAVPRFRVYRRDLAMAAAAVAAWVVVEHGAPELLHVDDLVRENWGALAALLLLVGAVVAVARLRPEGLLLVPFLFFAFDRHTKWAVLLAVLVVLLESMQWLRSIGSTVLRPSTTSWAKRQSSEP
jgi:hypothetical protein